ncbi:MAG: GFA family protein [Rhodospirillales bacterium]|nr:GFA family protein [Rhodospirillales bacterium]
MSETEVFEGGCLCGEVRYRITGPVSQAAHCHCNMCRRASGAPVVTWVSVKMADVSWSKGAPAVYPSSEGCERAFCAECGSQLTFHTDRYPDDIDITVGSLDRPEFFEPASHVWTSSALPWICLDEHLPMHEESTPGFE